MRHTWGYQKNEDAISLSQFINGITKRDGTIVDRGTGIKDKKTVRKALKGLNQKGFITVVIQTLGKREGNLFKLRINPSQELAPLPKDGIPPLPNNGTTSPSQDSVPTIHNLSIENSNNINKQDKKFSSIKDITQIEIELVAGEYQVPLSFVVSKFDDLQNYCLSKGRTYKNYLAALRNFVKQGAIQFRKEAYYADKKRGIDARHIK